MTPEETSRLDRQEQAIRILAQTLDENALEYPKNLGKLLQNYLAGPKTAVAIDRILHPDKPEISID